MGKMICDHAEDCLCHCPHLDPHDYREKCQAQPCTRGSFKCFAIVKCIPVPAKEGKT
jgi:hypothetical protein